MKIILKYMAMDMKEHKIRTVVMLLSILLSTTLLFVSFSINASYESAQQKMARGMAGSATVSIGAGEGTSNIVINRIPDLPSMQAKVGVLKGTAPVSYTHLDVYKRQGLRSRGRTKRLFPMRISWPSRP